MDFERRIENVLNMHRNVVVDPDRRAMIRAVVDNREALVARCGALATWSPVESTGRSPKDTLIVRSPEVEDSIDWSAPNNIPLNPDTFEMLKKEALGALSGKDRLYVTNRVLGADTSYALPVRTITDRALTALGRQGEAEPLAWDVSEIAARTGQPGLEARACLLLAQIRAGTEAEKSARRARELARQSSLAHVDILALTREAEISLAAGDLEDAEQSSAEALHKLSMRGKITIRSTGYKYWKVRKICINPRRVYSNKLPITPTRTPPRTAFKIKPITPIIRKHEVTNSP